MVFQEIVGGFNYFQNNNTFEEMLISIAAFGITLFVLYVLKSFGRNRIRNFFERKGAKRLEKKVDKIFESLGVTFYTFLPLYVMIQFLELPAGLEDFLAPLFYAVFLYYAVKIVQILIEVVAQRYIIKEEKEEGPDYDPTLVYISVVILKAALWVVAVLLLVSNLGFDVTALIASVGVLGIAIAFALQNVLADIFASVSIYLDKPFKRGDFIIVGDDLGTVKNIGIKTTRIDTLRGEELVIANRELTDSRVHNFKKMQKRRVVFGIGVTYDTSLAKLKKGKELITKAIEEAGEEVQFDRVHFQKFADFSLVYEGVYYVLTADYNRYMDLQQEINFKIKEKFEKAGIEFAFPTQTLYLKKTK